MPVEPTINWFGIRTFCHFGKKRDGTNIFEERVVVFSATTVDEAFAKAEREGDQYAADREFERHPWLESYWQDGDPLIDGYEVWSTLYQSSEDLQTFVKSRHEQCEYHPDL